MTISGERIVYLFGAGATQAEVMRLGTSTNLTMPALNQRIFEMLPEDKGNKLKDYFASSDKSLINIEHLISLLETLDRPEHSDDAKILRELFQKEILNGVREENDYIDPSLTKLLLQLHSLDEIKEIEELHGIITVSYDSLLDVAFQAIFRNVNYGIRFESDRSTYDPTSKIPFLLKLHGSFNWKSVFPIVVSEDPDFLYKCDSLWIPPSIYKKIENHPFNSIWGKAFELLSECTVLRIVGCSLNQNDWGLLSLLFRTQFTGTAPYVVEVIDMPEIGRTVIHHTLEDTGCPAVSFSLSIS